MFQHRCIHFYGNQRRACKICIIYFPCSCIKQRREKMKTQNHKICTSNLQELHQTLWNHSTITHSLVIKKKIPSKKQGSNGPGWRAMAVGQSVSQSNTRKPGVPKKDDISINHNPSRSLWCIFQRFFPTSTLTRPPSICLSLSPYLSQTV